MKKVRIGFTGFWSGHKPENSHIVKILKKHFEVEILDTKEESAKDKVEYLFYSVYPSNFLDFDCIRIFYTGENLIPDFNLCDYAIGFENMTIDNRYFRDPLWYAYVRESRRLRPDNWNRACSLEEVHSKKFCAMVVSNGRNADLFREKLFYKLSEYRQVDSGGRYLNNIGLPGGVVNKLAFLKDYKFSFAIENVSHIGYCTEKIIESFAAGTIPIYWGDSEIDKYFNTESFINCHMFSSLDEVIRKIQEIDSDDEQYLAMLRNPKVINDYYLPQQQDSRFENWLVSIFEGDYIIRRNRTGCMKEYEDRYRNQMNYLGM